VADYSIWVIEFARATSPLGLLLPPAPACQAIQA
jgi:hypothetical protein